MTSLHTVQDTISHIVADDINQFVEAIENYAIYNVVQYGADPTGATDSTTVIASALSDAHTAGGGIVFFPKGTYLTSNQTLYSNVFLRGAGKGVTIIKLKNGANTDLFSAYTSSIDLSASAGTGSTTDISNFGIAHLSLDGNMTHQSGTSYPLRFYGRDFFLQDIEVHNGLSGGVLIDWNGSTHQMQARLAQVSIHDNQGIGLQMGGPPNSHLQSVWSYNNTSHGFHFAPNAAGMLVDQCHPYNNNISSLTTVGYLIEAANISFTNCVAEGSGVCQVALIASTCSWIGGQVVTSASVPTGNGVGIQLGQNDGQTPYDGQILQSGGVTIGTTAFGCLINTIITNCQGGAVSCVNEQNTTIIAIASQTQGSVMLNGGGGFFNATDTILLSTNGLASDGSVATSGVISLYNNADFLFNSGNGQALGIDNLGNMSVTGFLNATQGIYFGGTVSPIALSSGDTISTNNVPHVSVTPSSDVTGIIMQRGGSNQVFILQNVSNFTITFDDTGISNVANGLQTRLLPNSALLLFFDAFENIWYPTTFVALPVESSSAPDPGANGTIATAGIDVARINPTAARTGCILQAGTYGGQRVTVINEATTSGHTITLDVSGMSNVAGGTSIVLGITSKMIFVWDSATSLWY